MTTSYMIPAEMRAVADLAEMLSEAIADSDVISLGEAGVYDCNGCLLGYVRKQDAGYVFAAEACE